MKVRAEIQKDGKSVESVEGEIAGDGDLARLFTRLTEKYYRNNNVPLYEDGYHIRFSKAE